MRETLEKIRKEALDALSSPSAEIEELRIRYLGKKGELTAVLRGMGKLSAEERPVIGQLANEVRAEIEKKIDELNEKKNAALLEAKLRAEKLDVAISIPSPSSSVSWRIFSSAWAIPSWTAPRWSTTTITSRP